MSRTLLARGAVFVELVLALPILLTIILTILWLALVLNARTSLTMALGTGVRIGVTRGDSLSVGTELINSIQDWVETRNPADQLLNRLLASEEFRPIDALPYYVSSSSQESATAQTFALPLRALPAQYTYTLAYIYEGLRQSVGNSLRYPCDPLNQNGNDRKNGFGCARCTFLNPDDFSAGQVTFDKPIPLGRMRVLCQYKPDDNVLRPLALLLKLDPMPSLVIERKAYFDIKDGAF